MMVNDPKEVLAAWETSSQYWNKHQALIEKMFEPLSLAIIEAAHISHGQAVLDVGGGSGEPSLTIASVVGETGSVTYTDPAAGMVRAARDEAARRGLANIRFQQCPAEHLPFADGSFDAAVGRLSAMFFPDVLAGLRETLRTVKPSGYVSFLVWAGREANPFFSLVSDTLDRFVQAEPEDEDAPAAFRFAAPGKLAALLREAGAASVSEHTLTFMIEAPITVAQFWELRTEMSDTFRKKLARLVPDQVAAIKYTVQKAVAEYFKTGSMSFPGQVLIVTGQKPRA
ncbi:MAG TPA: methyltransferase domain-containing protein [Pyrinomonadaceae bacterium]|jgi:ubiquinone/menaquinone biosynthesis C-methylase UbiE|nr:methyltransferase domain-containing protein [Pyrinomonadaceae bacterium]